MLSSLSTYQTEGVRRLDGGATWKRYVIYGGNIPVTLLQGVVLKIAKKSVTYAYFVNAPIRIPNGFKRKLQAERVWTTNVATVNVGKYVWTYFCIAYRDHPPNVTSESEYSLSSNRE